MKNLTISINDNSPDILMSLKQEDGTIIQKTVMMNDLLTQLTARSKFETGLLPFGTKFFSGSAAKYSVLIEIPPRVRDMKLNTIESDGNEKITHKNIAFPACAFFIKVENKVPVKTLLFSLKNPIQTMADELFRFPFCNVYNDDERICWGSAELPKINKVFELSSVLNAFFTSTFNGDLGGLSRFTSPNVKTTCFWSLIKYLEKKTEFETSLLKTSSRTIEQVMNNM